MRGVSGDSAILAWVGIVVFITAYVVAYDLWAHYSGHLTMTTQFRDWLQGPIMGPVIFGLWVAVPVSLTYHFLIKGK